MNTNGPRIKRFNPPWEDPGWRATAFRWIEEQAHQLGYSIVGQSRSVHARPWSTVLQVPTDRGSLYFKAGGPTQAFEPGLLRLLSERSPQNTLPLLAAEKSRGWSLMPDGGQTLRQIGEGKPNFFAWRQILLQYVELQIASSKWQTEMLTCGVPKTSSQYLIEMYSTILGDDELSLVGEGEDFLTIIQYERLQRNAPVIKDMFAELDGFDIPLCLEHGDLHDANIFVQDERYILFDWGDASLTHPFFTLLLPIRHLADKLGVSEYAEHPDLIVLRDNYLQPWVQFASQDHLLKAWSLANHLAKFARTVNWYRVVKLTVPELGASYRSSVVGWFQEFLSHPSLRLSS